ncbi:MAG TPA: hypothetical protein VF404_09485, partial [Sphingomonas sp.]
MNAPHDWAYWLIGMIDWHAFAFVRAWQKPDLNEGIAAAAAGLVVIGAAVTAGSITWSRKWRYLWSEWLTSVDHKKIGIM